MSKALFRGIPLLLAAAPAAFALAFIFHFAINAHLGDEWDPDMAGVFIKACQHQLSFGDLVSLHNEHRLLIPRLLYLLLNYFTHWDNRVDVIAGWAMMLAVSLCILRLIRKTCPDASTAAVAGRWFLCNLLIFSPAQYENWLSAWGAANAMPVAFTIAAVLVAADGVRSWGRLAACVAIAFASSYSNGCGFVAWIIVGGLMAWPDPAMNFRARRKFLIAWSVAFVLCAGAYAYHYHAPPRNDVYEPTVKNCLFFLTAFVANVFQFTEYSWEATCELIGISSLAILAAAAVYLVRRRRAGRPARRLLIWFAVAGFTLGSAVLGAMSRAGFGHAQAVISRYVTFSVFVPVALINLVPMICADLRNHARPGWATALDRIPAFLAAVLIVLQVQSIPLAIQESKDMRLRQLHQMGALQLLKILPNDPALLGLLPANPKFREYALAMNSLGYLNPPMVESNDAALVHQPDPQPPGVSDGSFEGINRPTATELPAAYGWACFPNSSRIADAIFLTYTDKDNRQIIFSYAISGDVRHDIADSLGNQDYLFSGWRAYIPVVPEFLSMRQVPINAWTLNSVTGKAYILHGAGLLTLQ